MESFRGELLRYATHQERGKCQDGEIRRITNLAHLRQSRMALVIFNQNKKVLPLYFRAEHVQFFGKRGSSVFGAMVCFRANVKFYGFVIEGHST